MNREAHDAHLKGSFHVQKFTPHDLDAALSYFELALEKDPDYAPAYVGIGRVWSMRRQSYSVPTREATPKERAAILRALELEESLAEVQYGLAALKLWGEWDWSAAELAFERALELNANDADTLMAYSHLLNILGRSDDAMVQIERGLALDPFNALAQGTYGNVLLFDRRYEEAIVAYRKALAISPNMPTFAHTLATALEYTGRLEEALEAQGAYSSAIGDDESRKALARGYAQGDYAEAMRQAADTLAGWSLRTDRASAYVSQLYASAGQKELALEWLERAFVNGDAGMPYLRMPGYDSVREDPRFQDLMHRMNLVDGHQR